DYYCQSYDTNGFVLF
nr:immunoglobulin light chain junction region [Macaca mulatta]